MPLYPPKVLRARDRALILDSSVVFTSDSHLNLSRSLGVRHVFPLNPIKASTKPTMINDDDFLKANCIK